MSPDVQSREGAAARRAAAQRVGARNSTDGSAIEAGLRQPVGLRARRRNPGWRRYVGGIDVADFSTCEAVVSVGSTGHASARSHRHADRRGDGRLLYKTDDSGEVQVNGDGEPLSEKGKCGHAPLVVGKDRTCPACGKLACGKCGFCSLRCQQTRFRALAARDRERAGHLARARHDDATAQWDDLPPVEAYAQDLMER